MYQPKAYSAPECEILTIQSADVLTLSNKSVYGADNTVIYDAKDWFASNS